MPEDTQPPPLSAALHDLADRPVDTTALLDASLRRVARRRRRLAGGTLAATVAVVAATAVGVAVLHGPTDAALPGPSASSASTSRPSTSTTTAATATPIHRPKTDVVAPGDQVQVNGVVLRTATGQTQLCNPAELGWDQPGDVEGYRPPSQCLHPTVVSGVDFTQLSHRATSHGVTSGWGIFQGVWTPGHLQVTRQLTWHPAALGSVPTTPPCPRPAAGWPRSTVSSPGTANLSVYGKYTKAHPGVIVTFGSFQPSPTQYVWVVAATDPAAVDAALRPTYGDRLCIIRSRWSAVQVAAAVAAVQAYENTHNTTDATPVYLSAGQSPEGQALVTLTTTVRDAAAEAVRQQQPAGLVTIDAWIQPR